MNSTSKFVNSLSAMNHMNNMYLHYERSSLGRIGIFDEDFPDSKGQHQVLLAD
jgi:hypothetical protein